MLKNYYILNSLNYFEFNKIKFKIFNNYNLIYNYNLQYLKYNFEKIFFISRTYNLKTLLIKYFIKKKLINKFNKKLFNFLNKFDLKSNLFKLLPDNLPLINLLKINKLNIINLKNIISSIGLISIKSTGINTFCTLTNEIGNVIITYSGGIFKDVKKIKEKKSLNIIRQLGQLISYQTYKCNFKYIFFKIDLISIKIRSILKNFYQGFIFMFKLYVYKLLIKRSIIRNGIKQKKLPRK